MRASSATSCRGVSSGRAGAIGLLSTVLLAGREPGGWEVDGEAGDAAVGVEVEDEGPGRVGAADPPGKPGHRHAVGVHDAIDLHGAAAERRHELTESVDGTDTPES